MRVFGFNKFLTILFILHISGVCWSVDTATGPDKTLHTVGSFLMAGGTYVLLRTHNWNKSEAFMASFILSLTIGVAKETFDPQASTADIAADGMGALGGSLVGVVFDF